MQRRAHSTSGVGLLTTNVGVSNSGDGLGDGTGGDGGPTIGGTIIGVGGRFGFCIWVAYCCLHSVEQGVPMPDMPVTTHDCEATSTCAAAKCRVGTQKHQHDGRCYAQLPVVNESHSVG